MNSITFTIKDLVIAIALAITMATIIIYPTAIELEQHRAIKAGAAEYLTDGWELKFQYKTNLCNTQHR